MTTYCTGAVDCPHCDALIARTQLAHGETAGDEWDTRRAAKRREARYGERDAVARKAARHLLGRPR